MEYYMCRVSGLRNMVVEESLDCVFFSFLFALQDIVVNYCRSLNMLFTEFGPFLFCMGEQCECACAQVMSVISIVVLIISEACS